MDLTTHPAPSRAIAGPVSACLKLALALTLAAASGTALAETEELVPPASTYLEAGLAYLEAGDYTSAKIQFENVLRIDDLPRDLRQQTEIYAEAARAYLAGDRLTTSGYWLAGVGNYRENSTSAGSGDTNDMFGKLRAGGRLNYQISDRVTNVNSVDYRFRHYDATARRNDSDLRWDTAISRARGEHNRSIGFRGRTSFRGDGAYRNDYGIYYDWRLLIDEKNQVNLGSEYRRRRYPEGPLRERSRHIVELSAGWTRSLMDGRASFTLTGAGGRETSSREDGDSDFYSLSPAFDFTINDDWSGFFFAWWQNDRYGYERITSDAADEPLTLPTRNDNLYEVGGGLIWDFADGWSLNPEVLYIRDQSNVVSQNYSSIEVWMMVRKDF
jgi:tetratricopeptide (TPR) repeat protein